MELSIKWKGKMAFEGQAHEQKFLMDARKPIGEERGPSPKELALAGVCGCTGMDVAALMRKHKQEPKRFDIVARAPTTSGHPSVFEKIDLDFVVDGPVDAEKLKEAVVLSQTKYCGVSAMMAKHCPIYYRIVLNGAEIARGQSKFDI